MTDSEKLEVLRIAFRNACKWLRENPPGNLENYFAKENSHEYLYALYDGNKDPEGEKWQALFIKEALEEIENGN